MSTEGNPKLEQALAALDEYCEKLKDPKHTERPDGAVLSRLSKAVEAAVADRPHVIRLHALVTTTQTIDNMRRARVGNRFDRIEEKIKALEQFQLLNFVGQAEPGVPYQRGTLALDSLGRMWFAVQDDDGKGDMTEPVWRLMSDRRLSVISPETRQA